MRRPMPTLLALAIDADPIAAGVTAGLVSALALVYAVRARRQRRSAR